MADRFLFSSRIPHMVEVQNVVTQTSNFVVVKSVESGYINTFFKKKMFDFFNRRTSDITNLSVILDKALKRMSV